MKTLIIKLLGLAALAERVETLESQVKHLTDEVEALEGRVQDKIDEIESPDLDDYVREDDINERIDSYLYDNDYATQSYCDNEIESKVSDAVESAIEDAGIEEKVRDLFNDASPAPMSVEEIKAEIQESVKVVLEKMVKALADQAR